MNLEVLKVNNLDKVNLIIEDAILFLAKQNIDQWQNNYPNKNTIMDDINNKTAFILVNEEKDVLAYASISLVKEDLYENIKTWTCDQDYAILHRTAVNVDYRNIGVFKNLIKEVSKYLININIKCIRIDTHPDNKIMIKSLMSCGFTEVGSMLYDQGLRLAYELCL